MRVLAERGLHAARVDDVVRAAEVSHGTFYLYFANKEALFKALATHCADDMAALAASLGPVPAGDAGRAELRRWITEFVTTYRRYGVVIRAWMEDQVADRSLRRLGARSFGRITSSLVDRLAAARGSRADEVRLEAAALLAMVERSTYYVTSRDLGIEDEALVETLTALVHDGFFATA
jgi:AcrR family transcriptional regulator